MRGLAEHVRGDGEEAGGHGDGRVGEEEDEVEEEGADKEEPRDARPRVAAGGHLFFLGSCHSLGGGLSLCVGGRPVNGWVAPAWCLVGRGVTFIHIYIKRHARRIPTPQPPYTYLVHHRDEHAGVDGGPENVELRVAARAAAPHGARAQAGEEAEAEDEDGVDHRLDYVVCFVLRWWRWCG